MRVERLTAFAVILFLGSCLLHGSAFGSECTVDWSQADALERAGDYAQAAQAYQAILAECPGSLRAAVMLAGCQIEIGHQAEAVQRLDGVLTDEGFGYWTEVGTYFRAKACQGLGCTEQARGSINLLKRRFFESPWTARALVIERQLDGVATDEAEARRDLELAAYEDYQDAFSHYRDGRDTAARQAMSDIISSFPGTGVALRARETLGHLQIRLGELEDAKATFLAIVNEVAPVAPESRLFHIARSRLGGLFHREEARDDALAIFATVVEEAEDPAIVSNARLQWAGLYFEILQRRVASGQEVTDADWAILDNACASFDYEDPEAKARMALMAIESLVWQHADGGRVVAAVNGYLSALDGDIYKQEAATARLLAAHELNWLGRHAEAIEHAGWIIERYTPGEEIWPGMEHLAQAYYERWFALRKQSPISMEVIAAGQDLINHFPGCIYSEHVRDVLETVEIELAEAEE